MQNKLRVCVYKQMNKLHAIRVHFIPSNLLEHYSIQFKLGSSHSGLMVNRREKILQKSFTAEKSVCVQILVHRLKQQK